MQTYLLKIIVPLLLVGQCVFASEISDKLRKADSLFAAKQYTQSFENYHFVLQSKQYTPAMLLRMAFIQEGLGHVSQAIYHLQLYHQKTNDPQALAKIEELAAKHKLEGYAESPFQQILNNLAKFQLPLAGAFAAIIIFFLAWSVAQRRKGTQPIGPFVGILFFSVLLFVQSNLLTSSEQAIVSKPDTYLMSGPSSGSTVVGIIDEGHQVKIKGKHDVWVRVEWLNEEAFIKQDRLLQPEI